MAPLFHIGGLNVTTLITLEKGGEIVLHRSFDPGAFLADVAPLRRDDARSACPAMFLFISQHPDFANADLTSMRMAICGGAPVPEPLIKLYNGRGIPINQGYGLTETVAVADVPHVRARHGQDRLGRPGAAVHRDPPRRRRPATSSPSRWPRARSAPAARTS